MKFMMMVKSNQDSEAGVPPKPELMAAMAKLTEDLTRTGQLVSTGGLLPSSLGARVALSGGKVTVTDGPFTEAKEIIGGYAIVQVNSKEEAVALGKRFVEIHAEILGPSYEMLTEIRQMHEMPNAAQGRQ